MGRQRKIWSSKQLSIDFKIDCYNTIIVPTVLYGAEPLVLRKRKKRRLLLFEMGTLRRILNIRWEVRVRNEEGKCQAEMDATIINRVKDIQIRRMVLVDRMDGQRLPRQALYARMRGKISRGMPRKRCLKSFKSSNWQHAL